MQASILSVREGNPENGLEPTNQWLHDNAPPNGSFPLTRDDSFGEDMFGEDRISDEVFNNTSGLLFLASPGASPPASPATTRPNLGDMLYADWDIHNQGEVEHPWVTYTESEESTEDASLPIFDLEPQQAEAASPIESLQTEDPTNAPSLSGSSVVSNKRKAAETLESARAKKLKLLQKAGYTRDKQKDLAGRYVDTKVHEVEQRRLRNVKPMKDDAVHANIVISYKVKKENGSLEDEVHTCYVDEINMQGIGADVFRCPVPNCDVALVRRSTVDRHFKKFHLEDPKCGDMKYNDHPTMSSYEYGASRPYQRRSKEAIAQEKAENGGKLKAQKKPKKSKK